MSPLACSCDMHPLTNYLTSQLPTPLCATGSSPLLLVILCTHPPYVPTTNELTLPTYLPTPLFPTCVRAGVRGAWRAIWRHSQPLPAAANGLRTRLWRGVHGATGGLRGRGILDKGGQAIGQGQGLGQGKGGGGQ